jgi:energy-coupling factor transporter ATP-binding protein EcfA2
MAGPLVSVQHAAYRYPDGVLAVDDISVDLRAGDVVGIAGGNGAGKSTLARLLNGLLLPSTGSVTVAGRDTRRTPVHELARTVGLAFQHPRSQLFARTVADELAFGPRNLGFDPRAVEDRVAAMAARFGLEDALGLSPFALPSPRRRLLALGAVLASEPRVLVLDEPTTGQDQRVRGLVADLIVGLQGDGIAVVCVSHDMPLLATTATRLLVLAHGRLVADGAPGAVLGDAAALAAGGLVAPQVTRLAAGLPALAGRPAILTVPALLHELEGPGLAAGGAAG